MVEKSMSVIPNPNVLREMNLILQLRVNSVRNLFISLYWSTLANDKPG